MAAFNVSLVLGGVELEDDVLEILFEAFPDAVPSSISGLVTVSAPVEAGNGETAARQFVRQLRAVLPAARPVRLDQDLVSISDIAERTDRSRESIRLLADGSRGPGGFPAPVGIVGDGIRVWPWAVVTRWFRKSLGQDLGERGVMPDAAARVDAWLTTAGRGQGSAAVNQPPMAAASG